MTADKTFYPQLLGYPFEVHFRHFCRYFNAIKLIDKCGKNEQWLDCACGSGYGSRLLSEFGAQVTGFDIDTEAIAHARQHYGTSRCIFTADEQNLTADYFACIISIETIEHVSRTEASVLLAKMKTWLTASGTLIITTPLGSIPNPNPQNPHHRYEYDMSEFCELLKRSGLTIEYVTTERVRFTDHETKDQATFRCKKSAD